MTDKEYWDRRARGLGGNPTTCAEENLLGYPGTRYYAETNANEYWAEGTQWWFWSNFEWFDAETRLQTPDDLKAYDPRLYDLLDRVYVDHHIPMDVFYSRNIKPARKP